MGLSRNKVAVPEGAAGIPPFKEINSFLIYLRMNSVILILLKIFSQNQSVIIFLAFLSFYSLVAQLVTCLPAVSRQGALHRVVL